MAQPKSGPNPDIHAQNNTEASKRVEDHPHCSGNLRAWPCSVRCGLPHSENSQSTTSQHSATAPYELEYRSSIFGASRHDMQPYIERGEVAGGLSSLMPNLTQVRTYFWPKPRLFWSGPAWPIENSMSNLLYSFARERP